MAPENGTAPLTQPHLHQHESGEELQRFDQLRDIPIGLDPSIRRGSIERLNVVAADHRILHDLYKKSHWNMRGHTFYQLHLLMDEHAAKVDKLIDEISERIQLLGGVAPGDPRHVAELTRIERAPDGVESVAAMLSRLLAAHELILKDARDAIEQVSEAGDHGTEDLLASAVVPGNELMVWFVAEHLVEIPLVEG